MTSPLATPIADQVRKASETLAAAGRLFAMSSALHNQIAGRPHEAAEKLRGLPDAELAKLQRGAVRLALAARDIRRERSGGGS